jgi:hypothetical protein
MKYITDNVRGHQIPFTNERIPLSNAAGGRDLSPFSVVIMKYQRLGTL